MRRLLPLLLALSLAPFAAPADAGCEYDPEGNPQCYAVDCPPYDPRKPVPGELVADPVGTVTRLLPPACPS